MAKRQIVFLIFTNQIALHREIRHPFRGKISTKLQRFQVVRIQHGLHDSMRWKPFPEISHKRFKPDRGNHYC